MAEDSIQDRQNRIYYEHSFDVFGDDCNSCGSDWHRKRRLEEMSGISNINEADHLFHFLNSKIVITWGDVWSRYKRYILEEISCGTSFASFDMSQARGVYYRVIEDYGYSGNHFNNFIW